MRSASAHAAAPSHFRAPAHSRRCSRPRVRIPPAPLDSSTATVAQQVHRPGPPSRSISISADAVPMRRLIAAAGGPATSITSAGKTSAIACADDPQSCDGRRWVQHLRQRTIGKHNLPVDPHPPSPPRSGSSRASSPARSRRASSVRVGCRAQQRPTRSLHLRTALLPGPAAMWLKDFAPAPPSSSVAVSSTRWRVVRLPRSAVHRIRQRLHRLASPAWKDAAPAT